MRAVKVDISVRRGAGARTVRERVWMSADAVSCWEMYFLNCFEDGSGVVEG